MLKAQHSLVRSLSRIAILTVFILLVIVCIAWKMAIFSLPLSGLLKLVFSGTAFFFILLSTALVIKFLYKKQKRLQSSLLKIIESMPNGIMLINQEGMIDFVNGKICTIFQYDKNELLGKTIEILMSPSMAEQYSNLRSACLGTPEVSFQEVLGITKFGKEVAVEIGLTPVEFEQGMQVLVSVVDISERKNTEHNLALSREKIEVALQKVQQMDMLRASIVEYSEDAIISKTISGVVTSWNKTAENMFGYSASEAIGKNVKELIVLPEDYAEHDELINQVKQGNLIRNYQSRLGCKNGKKIDVSLTFSPIKDDKGNIVSISSIKRDITESIKAASRLQDHQKELERSNKSLEAFAYVASHDLKAPLRGIRQLTTWLEEDIQDNNMASVPDTTQKIKVRIKRMEALLDDLLAYSRVEKMQGFFKKIDLNEVVLDLFTMNNIKPGIAIEIVKTLPVFETYATPLEHVINNLLSNAIKHHDKSEGFITVSSREIGKDWYELSIADDGPGIDPQFHQRIFNMFQTLKPRDEVEGSGMGLALVKKIVEQFGGSVGVESDSRGSRFYFTWPQLMPQEKVITGEKAITGEKGYGE